MAGCLDNCKCDLEDLTHNNPEQRNRIASAVSGLLFFVGWWIIIDCAAIYPNNDDMPHLGHLCGVAGTIAFFMVNSISTSQVTGEALESGFLGQTGARIWMFLGFLLSFASIIGAAWIMFGDYIVPRKDNVYPGVAFFLQNILIFLGSAAFKFGRTEDAWQ